MSTSNITLIDLNTQLPFEIDEKLKSELCFAETLVISCGHCEGENEAEDLFSDSESSCFDATESEISEEVKDTTLFETKDHIDEDTKEEELPEEEDDFHIYFFPDCNKPAVKRSSQASLITVDGIPKINRTFKIDINCSCSIDKQGRCSCYTKLPCRCGAKTTEECACSKLTEICICHDGKPQTECTCKGSNVCLCHPDFTMQPTCTCDQIDKPCFCHSDKFPSPKCTCKYKTQTYSEKTTISECTDEEESQIVTNLSNVEEQCECQKKEPEPRCICRKGEDCTCKEDSCICEIKKVCSCETISSQEEICNSDDNKSICACPIQVDCTCNEEQDDCKCFPVKDCSCGDPENCKCFVACDCIDPCICDTVPNKEVKELCVCIDKMRANKKPDCSCHSKTEKPKKLKRVRAGKHGYRWCHDVDPKHTYFDYAYDRHDKIIYKEPSVEKIEILGLHDEKTNEDACSIHGVIAPPYKKKIAKASIDCCSSVGGVSICVETLGEDKGKFLVQTVSHSSKEGAKCGSKLVSILDCNLHTMEENRTEHFARKGLIKERRSYMAICESGYYNKVTRICGDKHVVKRLYHTFEAAQDFLLEGANIVLLRYFGLRRYRGNVKTETVLMNGVVCESIYVCQGVSQAVVNGKPLFVVKVERHIIEPNGYVHQTLTVLTLRGYTVSHEWADNNCILHLNPLLRVVPERDEIEPHAPLREKWREDLQLLSDYLDYKSARTSEGGRYIAESGSLTNTIREYLQALLLLRPQDALHFTRHYFGSALSALDLPHDEYFDAASKHVRYYFFEE
ncbi:uncharacterized protein LOC114248666 [Bombyx mandarina]|uniref:Uncharacterized protein LOC114248666 n=1 Tax=Bombyx mandarina TaxID=7092 RepID=A0A6J2K723_BOMMA|nr:uncharacterized protein LOC114248666 [Bombyx mandarina]